MKHLILAFTLVLTFTLELFSAPIPGTSTSTVISKEKGIFFSELGFKLSAKNTDWLLTPPPTDSKYMLTLYKAPKTEGETRGSLSVRLDRLKEKQTLRNYVKKWLRRYPRFGFDVLGAKTFKNKGSAGYVIDLVNRDEHKQLRQVIYMGPSSAIVMTCRDSVDGFKESLKQCNQIIRSFEWQSSDKL